MARPERGEGKKRIEDRAEMEARRRERGGRWDEEREEREESKERGC